MSDNISTMNDKQLRNEVQLLRDELAIMRRKFEDIIYNLDTDNFSSRFVKEQGKMKTAIEVTAEGIKTKVSKEDLDKSLSSYSTIEQTADKISTAVTSINNSTDEKLKNYSTIEQTAEKISSTVTKEYVTDLIGDEYVTNDALNEYKVTVTSTINQKADEINLSVSSTYETQDNANSTYSSLRSSISSISIEADGISSRVGSLEDGQYGDYTLFTQSADKFYFDGDQTIFTGCIWLTNNDKEKRFSISHDESNPAKPFIQLYNMFDPLIIGRDQTSVYVGDDNNDNSLVATRGWVLDNAGVGGTVVAVFG